MPFEFIKQEIEGVILIKPKKFIDERGFFMENYKKSEFQKNGIVDEFIQDNYSCSHSKVLRGLHYQIAPYSQSKLVRCIEGKIYDIALDIRPNSKTFKKYIKVELSKENCNMLYIPKGFAHGFIVLEDNTKVYYKTSCEYEKTADRGIIWNDKELDINWGIDFEPILSNKDKNLPLFNEINFKELN